MKSLLKPSFSKIVLTLVLFVASSALWNFFVISLISDTFPIGFPLQFFLAWGPCQAGQNCSEFNGFFLVLDLVIWYLASSAALAFFKRRRSG